MHNFPANTYRYRCMCQVQTSWIVAIQFVILSVWLLHLTPASSFVVPIAATTGTGTGTRTATSVITTRPSRTSFGLNNNRRLDLFNEETEAQETAPPFQPMLISIEGNIGAGKSTLLNALRASHPEWIFIDEPVSLWNQLRSEANESVLEVFYNDRKRWSYMFQNCALMSRYRMIESAVSEARLTRGGGPRVFITERCLDTDYHVFVPLLREEGSMTKLEVELYWMLLEQLKQQSTPLSGIVYVDTDPVTCRERIGRRNRSGEECITPEYLRALDRHQRLWIEHRAAVPCAKTACFDGNERMQVNAVEKLVDELVLKSRLLFSESSNGSQQSMQQQQVTSSTSAAAGSANGGF